MLSQLEQRQEEMEYIDGAINAIREELKPIQLRMAKLSEQKNKLQVEMWKLEFPVDFDNMTIKDLFSTPWYVLDQEYKKYSKFASTLKYVNISGYNPTTNRRCVELKMSAEVPFKEQWKEIEPVVLAASSMANQEHFQLFTDDLSESGIPSIDYVDGKWCYQFTRYHSTHKEKEFNSIKEAAQWCYEHKLTYN
jgi:hypothetical protein